MKNINQYLIRGIDALPVLGNGTLVVYTKMCRIVILSLFNIPTDQFYNTKILKEKGILTIKQTIQNYAFFELLAKRAERIHEISSQMSEKQKNIVINTAKGNLDKFFNSEWYYGWKEDRKLERDK